MAGSESSSYLAAVKWGDEGYYLQEFTHKFTLPQVAKIIKGQYLSLGVPSLPSPSLNQIVFLASGGKRVKVAAQCVKFKDGRRVIPVGSKLAIPDNYDGWFEILSEDGRAVRCIESVAELLKKFPETCLIRENIKVHLAKFDDSGIVSDKTKTIPAGDTLVLVGEVKGSPIRSKSNLRYLRCFTTKGETVFLGTDQRGKFSPIAGEDNISGVHTIRNLLTKRFPLMVRLVHGKPPTGLKSNAHFVNEMRLYSLFEEESIVALPLLKDSHLISLPPSAPLKLQAPRNADSLRKLKEYNFLTEKCKTMIQEVSDRIQVFDISLSKELRLETKVQQSAFPYTRLPYMQPVKRSLSDPRPKENVKPDTNNANPPSQPALKVNVPEEGYDEIDQIYDYVRGFAPLPKVKSDFENNNNIIKHISERSLSSSPSSAMISPSSAMISPSSAMISPSSAMISPSSAMISPSSAMISPPAEPVSPKPASEGDKPEPPPIETIPVRKMSTEEQSAPTNGLQNITVTVSDKFPAKSKESEYKEEIAEDHIYEKIRKRYQSKTSEIPVRVPMRSNSACKIFIPNPPLYGINKMFIKSPAQQRIQYKSKIFKHSKSSPALKDVPVQKVLPRPRTTRSKSLTTSPLFNIRYKSLTNLAIDFDTLDSSNSGGMTSSGSGGSKDFKDIKYRHRKLPRPKSLTNLFCELNKVENFNKYNIMQNDITKGLDNKNLTFSQEVPNGKLLYAIHNKRIGTLYL